MTSNDDRLGKLIRAASERDSIPPFEATWRRAERAAADRRTTAGPWRWVLGPVVAAAAAAAVLLVLSAVGPDQQAPDGAAGIAARADAGVAAQLLADLVEIEVDELPTDELVEEGTAAAALDADPFESGTDFLLTLELPVWDETGERNLL